VSCAPATQARLARRRRLLASLCNGPLSARVWLPGAPLDLGRLVSHREPGSLAALRIIAIVRSVAAPSACARCAVLAPLAHGWTISERFGTGLGPRAQVPTSGAARLRVAMALAEPSDQRGGRLAEMRPERSYARERRRE
jgi:hypothetical protein